MKFPNSKIRPKSSLGGVNNQKLKPGPEWPSTATVDKMQLETHEELVMILISLHDFTP